MTYRSRGRGIVEIVVAVTFVGFLTGFVIVLCIGNYFRAKKAQERQRQRRLARLAGGGGNGRDGVMDSPRSHYSGSSSAYSEGTEQQHLLGGQSSLQVPHHRRKAHQQSVGLGGGGGDTVDVPRARSTRENDVSYRTQHLNPPRHRKHDEEDLLHLSVAQYDSKGPSSDVMSV